MRKTKLRRRGRMKATASFTDVQEPRAEWDNSDFWTGRSSNLQLGQSTNFTIDNAQIINSDFNQISILYMHWSKT
jgi:hypothetical protein